MRLRLASCVLIMLSLAGCGGFQDADLPPTAPAPIARGWPGCLEMRDYGALDEP